MRTINFYRHENGKCPVEIFLDDVSGKEAQKIIWVMRLIEELQRVPIQYFKKLVNTDDIWEIRTQSGNNHCRVLGFFEEEEFFIATHGFKKKTQKTPKKEILLAEKCKRDHLMRRYTS